MFSNNVLTAASLSVGQTQFSVNFLSSSIQLSDIGPLPTIQLSSSNSQPQFSFNVQSYQASASQVIISNIQSNLPSTLYFILVSYKNVTINQISSKTTITIKPLVTPTSSQIASCVDGQGFPAVQCFRVVMQSGSSYSVTLSNIVANSVYSLYYTVANEYPLRPVFFGSVQNQFIFTNS